MYVARIEIRLRDQYGNYPQNVWIELFRFDDIICKWRYKKDNSLEIILGAFASKSYALQEGKKLYSKILYRFLWKFNNILTGCGKYQHRMYHKEHDGPLDEFVENEECFFCSENYSGFFPGLAIYEVNSSIDEFEIIYEEQPAATIQSLHPDSSFPFSDLDKYREIGITYSEDSQIIFSLIEIACNFGEPIDVLVLCSALEMLSTEKKQKTQEEIVFIDKLISCVDSSTLEDEQKRNLRGFLSSGKEVGSRNRCLNTVRKYCKRDIAGFSPEEIFNEAYSIRSKIIHGGKIYGHNFEPVHYFKYVVLKVLWGVLKEKTTTDM